MKLWDFITWILALLTNILTLSIFILTFIKVQLQKSTDSENVESFSYENVSRFPNIYCFTIKDQLQKSTDSENVESFSYENVSRYPNIYCFTIKD